MVSSLTSVLSRSAQVLRVGLLATMATGVLAVGALQPTAAADQPDWAITATGTGSVDAPPDLAYFEAGALAIGPSANEAKDAAAAIARAVLSSLAAQGVAAADVQTSSIALTPVFSRPADQRDQTRPQTEPRIEAYRARISHRITVRSLVDLGRVIDAAVGAGAQEIGGLNFSAADMVSLENQALRLALADSRRMAQVLADEGKFRLGPVISAEIEGGSGPMPMRLMAAEAGTPIQPGHVTVRMRVRVMYAIDDGPQDSRISPTSAPGGDPSLAAPRAAVSRAPVSGSPAPPAQAAPAGRTPQAAPAAAAPRPASSDLFILPETSGGPRDAPVVPRGLFER
jgi:uncharacterized protein YggE